VCLAQKECARRPPGERSCRGTLLRSLVERGLDQDAVELVAADGAGGIRATVAEAFPDAAFQRCWTQYADLRIMPMSGVEPAAV